MKSQKDITNGLNGLKSLSAGTADMVQQVGSSNQQLLQLAQSLAQADPENKQLAQLAEGLEQQQGLLTVLQEGGDIQGNTYPGINALTEGITKSQQGLQQLSDNEGKISGGYKDLASGLQQSNNGMGDLHEGLVSGINEMRLGQAEVDMLKQLADNYTSFLGSPEDANSQVRFLIKTEAIDESQVDADSRIQLHRKKRRNILFGKK